MRSAARLLSAEARKLAGLPLAWLGAMVALVAPSALLLLARAFSSVVGMTGDNGGGSPDAGFAELTIGVVGVGLVAVQSVASEYARDRRAALPARQIAASLAAAPRRIPLLTAKLTVLLLAVIALAAVAVPATLAVASALHGGHGVPARELADRAIAVGLYWVLTTLLVFSGTVLLRSGIVPIALLILNNSVVSFSLVLFFLVPAGAYLPDIAGMRMYLDLDWVGLPYGPLGGGLVMAAWSGAALAAAGITFVRRDA